MAKESLKKQAARYHLEEYDEKMQKEILLQLKRRVRRRRIITSVCLILAIVSLGYFAGYYYLADRSGSQFEELADLRGKEPVSTPFLINKTGESETPDILDDYKNLYNKNKSLIGWLKIDDTIIDYPVMRSPDSEYYLTHNFNQEYDRNGSIFMDPACDVLKPSTNLILYGHHMRSGNMFGDLDLYESKEYMEAHRTIQFDTLYEKGTWQVMYVFRDKLKQDTEIAFKYYQFIDANSPEEFDSNMKAMAEMSLYDTGVKASYGDQLLTLSTCDSREEDGRFVVVAKRIG
ncbi:class B sortase [Lachnospiraceae bacterium JLR.KK008]